jgi:hypothetical protein
MSAVKSLSVRPNTVAALRRAARLYEGIASGELKVYATGPVYKFHTPDLRTMRDIAEELTHIMRDLET